MPCGTSRLIACHGERRGRLADPCQLLVIIMVMLCRDAQRAEFGLETKDFIMVANVPGITNRTQTA